MISARIEDYLEEIFAEEIRGRVATVTSLADRLKVTKGSVVAALRRLGEEGLLTHERYGTPSLTESGRARALGIFRRHEHLTFLLRNVLGVAQPKAENLACLLEHDLDADSEGRLLALTDFLAAGLREEAPWATALQDRLVRPGALPCPLSMLEPGEEGTVTRLTAEGSLRKRLLDMGLVPGTGVRFVRISPLGDPVEVEVRNTRLSLRRLEAAPVWVCRRPGECAGTPVGTTDSSGGL